MNDNLSGYQAPRGKAGVALLWPAEISKHVKKLPDGNERIQALEVTTAERPLCIVNTYMPTFGSASVEKFAEHLDIIHNIIDIYSTTHKIIICGDFNGSLLASRKNAHDKLLKQFVTEHYLRIGPNMKENSTFHGYGGSSSQIDYIFSTEESLVQHTEVVEKSALNLSTHVQVKTTIDICIDQPTTNMKTQLPCIHKFHWDKADFDSYESAITDQLDPNITEHNPEKAVELLTILLLKVSKQSVPNRVIKLKGHSFKLSPKTRQLMSTSKQYHYLWKNAGRPDPEHPLSTQRKEAKYNLRRQQRQDFATARDNLYLEIMQRPTDKLFHQLIRRARSSKQTQSCTLNVNGSELTDPDAQRSAFALYYEDLAVPKDHPNFEHDMLTLNDLQYEALIDINNNNNNEPNKPFTEHEIQQSIRVLNSGKSPDESHISAEHFKYAGASIIPCITKIFNKILATGQIPNVFKSGLINPIHKKGKDSSYMDNYRGITVSSIFGKLFEAALLNRISDANANQSELQYGFTKGLSPTMASLLVSEAIVDAKRDGRPLFIATLDTQKAFDVVHHRILLNKLYSQGITGALWSTVNSMYTGLSAKVKWQGDISSSFPIKQGVRQGGLLSTSLYKLYINSLLTDLEQHSLGKRIGTTYVGCPTVADDVLLMSEDASEFQSMLNIAYAYSQEHRYIIHPNKSIAITRIPTTQTKSLSTDWFLGTSDLPIEPTATHLGLVRCAKNENNINIDHRISVARRTLYSLMKSGVHGSNGLNPTTSYRIYQMYVLPRLLYSTEVLPLKQYQLSKLSKFHTDTLRNIQSLPLRTSRSAVLLLVGAAPLEAEIHKRQLSLIFAATKGNNSVLREVASRQTLFKDYIPDSFFATVSQTLERYRLPSVNDLTQSNISRSEWKLMTKKAVHNHWSNELRLDIEQKSTMENCNTDILRIGRAHPTWDTVKPNTSDVKKGIIKARILTGTYMLQTTKVKFNKAEIDPRCPMCRLEDEDLSHMLTRCPALDASRREPIGWIRNCIKRNYGNDVWNTLANRQLLTSLIIDCGVLRTSGILPPNPDVMRNIETYSRLLCYRLHVRRLHTLQNN